MPFVWPGGGTLRHLTNWTRSMDWDRFEVTLILGGPFPKDVAKAREHLESIGPVHVLYLDGLTPRKLFWGGMKQLQERLVALRPDVLHTIFIQSDIAGSFARRKAGVPAHVSSLEGALVPPTAPLLKRQVYKLGYAIVRSHLDAVIAISDAVGDEAARDFGIPLDRIRTIHSGIDLDEFQLKQGWPYSSVNPPKTVGMIARLSSEKLPQLLVSAAARVLARCPGVHFVFVGSGPEEIRLKTLTRDLNVEKHFEFSGWSDCVGKSLLNMDVFVFTSKFEKFEGLPWTVLEAQAAGVPTVASAVGGVPEIITDGQNGLLLRENTPEELAEKIVWMLENREQAAAMSRTGRRQVESHFTAQREVEEIQALYESLCPFPHIQRAEQVSVG